MGSQERRKIGLALGGGGARGLAHIGVLKVLEREGVPVDCLAGTSMGGLIGALYASGLSVAEIEAEVGQLSKIKEIIRLVDLSLTLRASGVLKGSRIYRFMTDRLGAGLVFSDLRLPLAVVTVDVPSGSQLILTSGSVAAAVRATISVPGIFEPVAFGDYQLVDGGLLNNVPVDVARKIGAEVVIAVDVLPDYSVNKPGKPVVTPPLRHKLLPKLAEKTYHIQLIMVSALTKLNLACTPPDVLIRPDLPHDLGMFTGFDRAETAIAAGEAAAEALLPQIKGVL